jgi:hypothetical protein
MNALKYLLVILSSEVVDSCADSCLKGGGVLEASLHVGFVVVTSETSHETSKEISDFNGVEREVSAADGITKFIISWNWECKLSKRGSHVSSTIIVSTVEVCLHNVDIGLDCGHVSYKVLVCGLVGLHCWLCFPVVEPALSGCNVSSCIWASSKIGV